MISNFIKRAITGILFVAILVGCILYNSFSFGILFMAISALTIYEFGQLINSRAEGVNVNKTIIMLGGAYLFLAVMDLYRRSRLQDFHSLFAVAALFDDQRIVSEKGKFNA